VKIHLWKYLENNRNYAGYHLTADAVGCEKLLSYLDRGPTDRSLRLQPVTATALMVPNNCDTKAFSFLSWQVQRCESLPSSTEWIEREDHLLLSCTNDYLIELSRGVRAIAEGRGDYCAGKLWFWWFLE